MGLALVPAVPVALAQPYVTGMNVTPVSQAVAPGANFSVYVWTIDDVAQAYDSVAVRLAYNSSLVNVTAVTPNPYFLINLVNTFNNSYDPANNIGMVMSDNGWLGANRTVSNWSCLVNFTAGSNQGVSPLDLWPVEDINITTVMLSGNDLLNWSLVTNGSVTISNGATCCVDAINGNGTVKIDGNTKGAGECQQDGSLNHTFILLATADAGWQFANWTGDVNSSTANPASIEVLNGGTKNISATFTELPPQACVNTTLLDFGTLTVGGANPANKSVNVTNCGGGSLNWNSNLTWLAQPGVTATISRNPTSGGPLAYGEGEIVEVAVDITGETVSGTYTANISINPNPNPNVTVTFYLQGATEINPCRNITLPHGSYIYAGESYNVNVSWTTCNNTVSGLGLIDNTTVTNVSGSYYWDNVTFNSESPAAANKVARDTGNTSVEYQWTGDINASTFMWVSYNATVPAGTAPGWYNMTICPDNNTASIEYYIGETAYVNCIGCQYQIYVAAPVYVEGTVWEVVWNWFRPGSQGNPGNLTLENANVSMNDTTPNSSLTNAVGYYNISVAPGNYTLTASLAGFATETYGWVNVTGTEGVIVIDFIGVNGLEPNSPFYTPKYALSYALKAVNCYLIIPSVPAAALTPVEMGNVTACWLATP